MNWFHEPLVLDDLGSPWIRPFQLGSCFANLSGSSGYFFLLLARKEILAIGRLTRLKFECPLSWGSNTANESLHLFRIYD